MLLQEFGDFCSAAKAGQTDRENHTRRMLDGKNGFVAHAIFFEQRTTARRRISITADQGSGTGVRWREGGARSQTGCELIEGQLARALGPLDSFDKQRG